MNELNITDVRVHPGDSGFLLDDGHTALVYDTGFAFTGFAVADKIKCILGDRPLDYIFLTHSHYDHAAGTPYLKQYWPNAQVVAGTYAAQIFAKPSAKTIMRDLDGKIAKQCGIHSYEDLFDELKADITVCDGDVIRAGSLEFTAVALPGHTKCSIGYYCPARKLLLGCETIGVYDGGRTVVPSYLVSYDMTIRSIEKVEQMDIENILMPHLGLLDREQTGFFLRESKKSAVETAEQITRMLKAGCSRDSILAFFKEKFYHGYIKAIYPIDAMELNTGITIDLLQREFQIHR